MGRAIVSAAGAFPGLTLIGAISSPGSTALGRDSGLLAGGPANQLTVSADLAAVVARAQVVIDFSGPEATEGNLAACVAAGTPLLLGSTGFAPALEAQFAAAARRIALLVAPNTSLGVTLLCELTRLAAAALPGYRLSISETHHAGKLDAPSGTALALRTALTQGRAGGAHSEIPIVSHREGEIVGEHTVAFHGPGEELFLTHKATDRAIFAKGALAAALWLASKPPGRYAMRDLLPGKTAT